MENISLAGDEPCPGKHRRLIFTYSRYHVNRVPNNIGLRAIDRYSFRVGCYEASEQLERWVVQRASRARDASNCWLCWPSCPVHHICLKNRFALPEPCSSCCVDPIHSFAQPSLVRQRICQVQDSQGVAAHIEPRAGHVPSICQCLGWTALWAGTCWLLFGLLVSRLRFRHRPGAANESNMHFTERHR